MTKHKNIIDERFKQPPNAEGMDQTLFRLVALLNLSLLKLFTGGVS